MRFFWKYLLIFLVFVIFFFFGDIVVNVLDNGRGCKKLEKIYIETYDIYGIVKAKYNDTDNHGVRTLEVLNKGNRQNFKFHVDMHGFYEFITEGDSIVKPAGVDTLKVFRNGVVRYFLIDFNCKPYQMPRIRDILDSKFKKWS